MSREGDVLGSGGRSPCPKTTQLSLLGFCTDLSRAEPPGVGRAGLLGTKGVGLADLP